MNDRADTRTRSPERRSPGARLLEDEEGATFVEYIVVITLIAVAAIVAWSQFETAVEEDASEQYTTFGTPPDE